MTSAIKDVSIGWPASGKANFENASTPFACFLYIGRDSFCQVGNNNNNAVTPFWQKYASAGVITSRDR